MEEMEAAKDKTKTKTYGELYDRYIKLPIYKSNDSRFIKEFQEIFGCSQMLIKIHSERGHDSFRSKLKYLRNSRDPARAEINKRETRERYIRAKRKKEIDEALKNQTQVGGGFNTSPSPRNKVPSPTLLRNDSGKKEPVVDLLATDLEFSQELSSDTDENGEKQPTLESEPKRAREESTPVTQSKGAPSGFSIVVSGAHEFLTLNCDHSDPIMVIPKWVETTTFETPAGISNKAIVVRTRKLHETTIGGIVRHFNITSDDQISIKQYLREFNVVTRTIVELNGPLVEFRLFGDPKSRAFKTIPYVITI